MASIIDRDHYVDNLLDRIDALEEKVADIQRTGLISVDGSMVIGEGNVKVNTEGIALVDDGHASVTKLKWKDENFQGSTLGDILSDWTQVATEDVVTWIRAFEHPDQTTGEAQIILKVDNQAQTDDTRLTLKSATHEIEFGGVDLFEIRDDAGDTLYFSADDTEGIIADGVQMKDNYIIAGGMPGAKAHVHSLVINDNTNTVLNFSTQDWDSHAFWTAGTPSRFTIPAGLGGRYLVCAYSFADASNAFTHHFLQIRRNTVIEAQNRTEPGANTRAALTCVAEVAMAATDYFTISAYHLGTSGNRAFYFAASITRLSD